MSCFNDMELTGTIPLLHRRLVLQGNKGETRPSEVCEAGAGKVPLSKGRTPHSLWGSCCKNERGKEEGSSGAAVHKAELGHTLGIAHGGLQSRRRQSR